MKQIWLFMCMSSRQLRSASHTQARRPTPHQLQLPVSHKKHDDTLRTGNYWRNVFRVPSLLPGQRHVYPVLTVPNGKYVFERTSPMRHGHVEYSYRLSPVCVRFRMFEQLSYADAGRGWLRLHGWGHRPIAAQLSQCKSGIRPVAIVSREEVDAVSVQRRCNNTGAKDIC